MTQSRPDATQQLPIHDVTPIRSADKAARILDTIDSYIIYDFISPDISDALFYDCLQLPWGTMYHHGGPVPRLVCIQTQPDHAGWTPLYRHPADPDTTSSLTISQQFSKSVKYISDCIEQLVKHPVNHVLIQQYRTGEDFISEHADKTVDVVPNSKIVNFSLGAERRIVFRQKKGRRGHAATTTTKKEGPVSRMSQKVELKHGSALVMGLWTNQFWTHAINPDKRPVADKTEGQKKFDGVRISLTFRYIGTFVYPDIQKPLFLYGVGSTSKSRDKPANVVPVDCTDGVGWTQAVELLTAFADENRLGAEFDWAASYGNGFDVVEFPPTASRPRA
ncbi:hypothetical protein V1525DRAFT_403648 [Lipomyces kononenkoae]|uniref:Uncharacterized protein n=1 Tax=Lipomyces kononenkoae TaxID=34357 RepID=A0ACC3T120_LIPKO